MESQVRKRGPNESRGQGNKRPRQDEGQSVTEEVTGAPEVREPEQVRKPTGVRSGNGAARGRGARGQNRPLDSSKSENRKPMSVKNMLQYMKLDRVFKTVNKKEINIHPNNGFRTPSTPIGGARYEGNLNHNNSAKSHRERVPEDLTPGVSLTSIKVENENRNPSVQSQNQVGKWKVRNNPEDVDLQGSIENTSRGNESLKS